MDTVLKIVKTIWGILVHFVRRVLYFTTQIVISLITTTIYIVTFEPHTYGKMTRRKVKRINFMSKLKLYLYKYFGWFFDFIHDYYFRNYYHKNKYQIEK